MTSVFIGGSRSIKSLKPEVQKRIDRILEQNFRVLVGDAPGADKAVQAYLSRNRFQNVEVFCAGNSPRNNVGGWALRRVSAPPGKRRDRAFYTVKDRAMTDEADYGLMLWDGESKGTILNVLRLLDRGKKVVLYVGSEGHCVELRSPADWSCLVSESAKQIFSLAERELAVESGAA